MVRNGLCETWAPLLSSPSHSQRREKRPKTPSANPGTPDAGRTGTNAETSCAQRAPARDARPLRRRPAPPSPASSPRSRSAPVQTLGARRPETHCSCPGPIRPPLARGNEGQRRGLPPPHPSRGPVGSASAATPTCAGTARASAAELREHPRQRVASRPRNVWHESVCCAWATPPAVATPPTRATIERPRPPRRLEGPRKCRRCLAWTRNLTRSLQLPPPPCSLVC